MNSFLILATIFGVVGATLLPPKTNSCVVSLTDLNPEPVLVNTAHQFIYPKGDRKQLTIPSGQKIILTCAQASFTNYLLNNAKTIEAKCISNTKFSTGENQIEFNDFQCSADVQSTLRITNKPCAFNGIEIETGFKLDENNFIKQIVTCFDKINYNSLYTSYKLTYKIAMHQRIVLQPNFSENEILYDLNTPIDILYSSTNQRITINRMLGLPEDSTQYISPNYYLTRGSLAAKLDFVYTPQQKATFQYINVAPQWQTINGGNWRFLESDIREYTSAEETDLIIHTGTYGITTLPHAVTGEAVPIYLYVDKNENKVIPVPELFWKVVYNPDVKEGIVFVTVNNPYVTNPKRICRDISEEIDWLRWKRNNVALGFSYVCNVNDFRKKVRSLPQFEVVDLLV